MKIRTNLETVTEIKKVIEQNSDQGNCIRIYVAGVG